MKFVLTSLVAVALILGVAPVVNANLLADSNPGFEISDGGIGADNWESKEGFVRVTDVKYSGDASMRYDGLDDDYIYNLDFFGAKFLSSLMPDTEYTLSAWIKTDNVSGLGGHLRFVPYGGSLVETSWVGATLGPGATSDWTLSTATFTTPADISGWTGGRIDLDIRPGGTGTVWVDDVTLVPEPMTLTLLGLGGLLIRRRTM